MTMFFGVPLPLLFGQITLGLINGAFYAILSLGLSIIFGLLGIVNLVHGALFMTGAFAAWFLLNSLSLGFWWALVLAPVLMGVFGMLLQVTLIKRVQGLDHFYALILTLGMALVLEGAFRTQFGSASLPYQTPAVLQGAAHLGFMVLPYYRAFVVVISVTVCLGTWLVIEKTQFGALLRAATENARMVQAFGVNVPLIVTLTYGVGVALAAFAGVLAAPIYSVNPLMGNGLNIVVFAIVVIGGIGSIQGSIVTGFALGVVEGLTKVFAPQASSTVIFFVMIVVLLVRPAGLFGRGA